MDNPKAIINFNNIAHNIQQVKNRVQNSKILAVIKADAYGHGAVKLAEFLDSNPNISAYGVSRYSEAMALYDFGIKKPILLLEGVLNKEQLISCIAKGFWLTINSIEQLELLSSYDTKDVNNKSANIWLKFDTGMNRLGFGLPWEDNKRLNFTINLLINLLNKLIANKKINNRIVIMSHFACADDAGNCHSSEQLKKFNYLVESFFNSSSKLTFEFSMSNSAGIFAWPQSHFDWVRPGICLYGSSPLLGKSSEDLNLKPSMSMHTNVISIKTIKVGDTVGYGGIWQAKRDTLVAIIACGYADCYARLPQSFAKVWINNHKCLVIGRVSMDMIAIDCTDVGNIKVGDEVEIWGDNISIDEVAYYNNTLSYEMYTRITARVVKDYVY